MTSATVTFRSHTNLLRTIVGYGEHLGDACVHAREQVEEFYPDQVWTPVCVSSVGSIAADLRVSA